MRTATAILSVLTVALAVSGCRKDSPLSPSGQTQAESKAESRVWPCIDRPRSEFSADTQMFRKVSKLGILPDIQNMTPQNAALGTKANGTLLVLMEFYGDPREPSIPSLADFSDLADNPHAQKALGEAFVYLGQKDGTASMDDMERAMTDQERSYFTTVMDTLFPLFGAADVNRLEVPLIGTITTPDSRSYLNLMLSESERLRVDLDGMPDNRRALWWLEYRTGQVIDKLNVGCAK